ncbi:MAG TPA: nucleotidyltransferase family protein [Candidatus Sulfotelmatobacter sp.]|jgi:hypothetical protein
MPSATLEAEWSLLLAACSEVSRKEQIFHIRSLSRESIRWEVLFDLAERHGTLPLLHQAVVEVEDVRRKELSSLKQRFQTNLHKTLLLSCELIRILDHLSGLGLQAMPYKGLALAETIYGDIALRQSGDIDLLIHPQDFPHIRDAVRDLGYMPHLDFSPAEERAYLKSGYECAFDGPAGPNLLEVQWAMQPRFYAIDFEMNCLFQRAITVPVAGRPMPTPAPEDLVLLLSAHAAKHVWGRLIWLCDIARIMALPTLDWNWIGSQAQALGIVRIVRVTMVLANRLLNAVMPSAAQTCLPEDPVTPALADEIQTHLATQSSYNVESVAYFRLMMRLRERPADRLRFLKRLAFTSGPSDWQAVHLPPPLFPIYRLVRLSRLAARFVRT